MSGYHVEITDVQLVQLARAGDKTAFTALFHRHNSNVYNLALRLTESRDLATEVSQETWIRVWRGLPTFRGDAAFATWTFRITVNTASTWRTRRTRRATVDLADVVEPEVVDSSELPEKVLENAELGRRLHRALASLSPALRTVVVMKDVYGWSHQEIAETLGLSVPATKVRLHRAHQRLQTRMRGQDQ